MILINDGEFLAGSTWVVGYKPTDEDSVKINGGLWLNEVGMEDTKEETTMIDLSGVETGGKFLLRNGEIVELVAKGKNYATKGSEGILILHKKNGTCDEYKAGSANLMVDLDIVSKHEPVILMNGEWYKFMVGGLVDCLGTYIENRKSFMNCGNKVCGATEATNIVRLDKANG